MRIGREGGGLLVAAKGEFDSTIFLSQYQVGIFLSRDAENALDTLGFEMVDREVVGFSGRDLE